MEKLNTDKSLTPLKESDMAYFLQIYPLQFAREACRFINDHRITFAWLHVSTADADLEEPVRGLDELSKTQIPVVDSSNILAPSLQRDA